MITGTIGKAEKMTSYVTSGGFRWYLEQSLKFTPAAGTEITQIRLRTKTTAYTNLIPGFAIDSSNELMQVWTGRSSEPLEFESTAGQNRCFWIEVTTQGAMDQVTMPVCSASAPAVGADDDITLTCSTPGATIHYTLDGSEPTTDSPVYSAPFKLKSDAVVRAIAVKTGLAASFPIYEQYFVIPSGCSVAKYDFSDWKSLEKQDGSHYTDANLKYAVNNISLVINDVTFVAGNTKFRT
ncbi:MAG: chitobiase/beta-hexosaminidase C-terminal domain-containing protein, partial [Muribaculaceae bacterium]|nr:chitobiase/beta-hexosaminidase C-terminal domain-containing protein [Muribaculaceae bacterium]